MNCWLEDLLDATRAQNGAPLPLRLARTSVLPLLREVIGELDNGATARVRLENGAGEELFADLDRERVRRMLSNVIANALKYSPQQTEVWVRVARSSDASSPAVDICIEDQGIGIPADDQGRLFRPFHRGANVKDHFPGTGLGLTTARTIADQHGGTLQLHSAEGQGTQVILRLPLPHDEQEHESISTH
jgi:signal transduction histidine kinase